MSWGHTGARKSMSHSIGTLNPFRGLPWKATVTNLAQQEKIR